MGTRGLLVVKNKQGEIKLAEYIPRDSYPSYSGVEIYEFCKDKEKLEKLQRYLNDNVVLVEDIYKGTSEENIEFCEYNEGVKMLNAIIKNFDNPGTSLKTIYPESRMRFGENSLFCEWAYMIDFELNCIRVFKGMNKYRYNQAEEFKLEKPREGYWGIEPILRFDLNSLPETRSEFLDTFRKMDLYV